MPYAAVLCAVTQHSPRVAWLHKEQLCGRLDRHDSTVKRLWQIRNTYSCSALHFEFSPSGSFCHGSHYALAGCWKCRHGNDRIVPRLVKGSQRARGDWVPQLEKGKESISLVKKCCDDTVIVLEVLSIQPKIETFRFKDDYEYEIWL